MMTNAHEEGRVYAIDDGQGCVKIGWAKDPVRRLREMNVSDAGRLTLIGSARGTRAHEAETHALLRPWRTRGEWFRKEGHVLAFLDMLPKYLPEPPEPVAPCLMEPRQVLPKDTENLLSEIESAARVLGIAPTTLCQRALKNLSLPKRLASGSSVTLVTADRIRSWIRTQTFAFRAHTSARTHESLS